MDLRAFVLLYTRPCVSYFSPQSKNARTPSPVSVGPTILGRNYQMALQLSASPPGSFKAFRPFTRPKQALLIYNKARRLASSFLKKSKKFLKNFKPPKSAYFKAFGGLCSRCITPIGRQLIRAFHFFLQIGGHLPVTPPYLAFYSVSSAVSSLMIPMS